MNKYSTIKYVNSLQFYYYIPIMFHILIQFFGNTNLCATLKILSFYKISCHLQSCILLIIILKKHFYINNLWLIIT